MLRSVVDAGRNGAKRQGSVLHCVALCCSVCVGLCCSVFKAECCSVLQCVAVCALRVADAGGGGAK